MKQVICCSLTVNDFEGIQGNILFTSFIFRVLLADAYTNKVNVHKSDTLRKTAVHSCHLLQYVGIVASTVHTIKNVCIFSNEISPEISKY